MGPHAKVNVRNPAYTVFYCLILQCIATAFAHFTLDWKLGMGWPFKCETKHSHSSLCVRRRGKKHFLRSPQEINQSSPSRPPFALLSRCNPTGRPSTAQTFWTTLAAWLCWWWASCCSPPSWSWLWLHTADWPDTSSWACVSSPTAGPSIRTYPPRVSEGEAQEAAVADKGPQRGTGRVVCGFRTAQLS